MGCSMSLWQFNSTSSGAAKVSEVSFLAGAGYFDLAETCIFTILLQSSGDEELYVYSSDS